MLQAHPPIAVTDLTFDVEKAKKELPEKHYYVYKIIYELNSNPPQVVELAKTSFLEIVTETNHCFLVLKKQDENSSLAIGDTLSFKSIELFQQKNNLTFIEFLRLIKDMEIGKPSTYGSILEKLFSGENAYLEIRDDAVCHSKLGTRVYDSLQENNGQLSSFKFSIEIEAVLDDIERGEADLVEILNDYLSCYIDFEIDSLDVDFELKKSEEKSVIEDAISLLIPDDHYLQGIKLKADYILSKRNKSESNKYYKLRILFDYYNLDTIERLSERVKYDLLFRWFIDLELSETIPSNEMLTNYIFSENAITLNEVLESFS